jgi:prefoldin subunit 5
MDNHNINRMLGRIEGRLEGIDSGIDKLQSHIQRMDERLRTVETRSLKNGTIAGALMGVGTGILAGIIRAKVG